MYSVNARTTSAALPSFSHYQHHETDAAKRKTGAQRPRKTKIGTEVAHVTRDSDTTFKVKRSKVNLLLMS